MKSLLITILVLSCCQFALANSPDTVTIEERSFPLVLRFNANYVPVNKIEFTNFDVTYDVYDNLFYRFNVDYLVVEFLYAGVSFEYMSKNIDPVSYHNKDITAYNVLADFKLIHNFTDTGNSKLLAGFGTGLANLKEDSGGSNSNVIFYVAGGLDIAVWKNIGFDFVYRYQFTKLEIDHAEYSYNGSTLQFGLNYGIEL